jgi:hypothetical protein
VIRNCLPFWMPQRRIFLIYFSRRNILGCTRSCIVLVGPLTEVDENSVEFVASAGEAANCVNGLVSYAVFFFLRKNLRPATQTPPIVIKATLLHSGTAAVAAENEDCKSAWGLC